MTKHANSLSFQIKAVELLGFLLMPQENEVVLNDIRFDIQLDHKTDIKQNLVAVVTTITLSKKESKLAEISTSCVFTVNELAQITKDADSALSFMTDALNSIAISTTRGYLSAQLKGTYLHHTVLPVIDPRKFKQS